MSPEQGKPKKKGLSQCPGSKSLSRTGEKMDFTIPEACKMIQNSARDFMKNEVEPIASDIDEADEVPEDILRKMKSLGFFGITIPEEYGGSGFDLLAYCFAIFELAKVGFVYRSLVSINNGLFPRILLVAGTEKQKQRYLPDIARGEKIAAFALTEPEAGSDAAGVKTWAEKQGKNFILNGTKHFITNGPSADVVLVVAATDTNLRARGGISVFLVDKGTPGFSVGTVHKAMGLHGEPMGELVFENCVVPHENLVGEAGRGFQIIMVGIDEGRATISAAGIGAAEKLLELSVDYAKHRLQFGKPIAEFGAVQVMLADMATEIYAAKTMLYHTVWKLEQGEKVTKEASMVKLYSSEMANRVADMAVQIHGGYGYMRGSFVERAYRDLRCLKLVEGTSQIQQIIITKELMK
jgi:acyl-CoA dehydrogenase